MAPTATSPLSRRRKRHSKEGNEPAQLRRPPPESYKGALDLLSSKLLTRHDVDAFLRGQYKPPENNNIDPNIQAYNDRRREIRELAAKVESGGATIDEHERLVPTTTDARPEPAPGVPLPPAGPPIPLPINPADHEEEERRWLEREDQEAAEAIARAVRRYRQEGVPEEDFVLIRIAPREQNTVNLTFRRICFAVLAVTTAFIVIMLQTMPLMRPVKQTNLEFDDIMYELLEVRHFQTHVRQCKGMHRRENNPSLMEKLLRTIWKNASQIDCSFGVLHIPSKHLLFERRNEGSFSVLLDDFESGEAYLNGVNVSWFHECSIPLEVDNVSTCFPGSNGASACPSTATPKSACFRGVHDGMISSREVDRTLRLAGHLIQEGGDHTEIHRNVSHLFEWIPSVVTTLEDLLHSHYHLQGQWKPVAFRISVALPMDGTGVRTYGSMADSLLERTFNRTVYNDWLESTRRKNELASYSLPPPFATKSFRDVCYLMSDLEADPDFAVHTSVFLSDAAGIQYAGGAALYVDDHPSNANPRNKIQRGISIDGSRGRVVVSSGGAENRRCRLPTRAGIRAVLQIWWNCT